MIHFFSFGQDQVEKDSLINEMCKTIKSTKDLSDSARIDFTFEEHLYPYLAKFPDEEIDEIWRRMYYRFLKSCNEFMEIIDRVNSHKGDWETITEKPNTNLSKRTCKRFLDHQNYSYLEPSGDTVNLQIKDGYWIDHFKDGTFSKLKFDWVNDCEFDVEFIESNNESRMYLSETGDKYRYKIVDKKDGYYDMVLEGLGYDTFYRFKIYY